MPRVYTKKVGGRPYQNYTPEQLEEALSTMERTGMSERRASESFGISRATLHRKFALLKKKEPISPREPGGQTVLSSAEEIIICSHVVTMASFGFPVSKLELRLYVKAYLDSQGKTVPLFRDSDNLPGKDWADSFVSRHDSVIRERMSQSVSRYRAGVNRETVNRFFDELGVTLAGVPASNIWNYDETNLQDDPGRKKVLVKKGCKHPEIIKNATKASVSIMMCGSAEGILAPPYVTYKAANVYPGWIEGGPHGTRYNRSKSGWFDSVIFEDWFEFTMLPILRKQAGTKVLIGDNLSSHLSFRVLTLCAQHDIKFVALPPHSTHFLQPLDVSFFKPMKVAWRALLDKWKATIEGQRSPNIPKTRFPHLLKELIDRLNPRAEVNLHGGFRGTGICPLDREIPLSKLHDNVARTADDGVHIANVSTAFMTHMQVLRESVTQKKNVARKRKVNVPPGRGITVDDLIEATPSGSCTAKTDRNNVGKKKKPQKKKRQASSSSEEESPSPTDDSEVDEESDSAVQPQGAKKPAPPKNPPDRGSSSDDESAVSEANTNEANQLIGSANRVHDDAVPHLGDLVIIMYDGKKYPGRMMSNIDASGEACISAMKKKGALWVWPDRPDAIWYGRDSILKKLPQPVELEKGFLFKGSTEV